jgi:hypothetical protein
MVFPADKDEVRSPKRACTERRNVLVDNNSFRSPVKDIIKSKLPPLQSAFARLIFLPGFFVNSYVTVSKVYNFGGISLAISQMLKWNFYFCILIAVQQDRTLQQEVKHAQRQE